ncbi:Tubulin/FtsZ, GTPase domain-containing protein [Ochromonadaceae sp. CCMP2298]|nr:Tubulin/FtsZ, GTPase domain-containing protein [Ochromonadaceae sp. CCMP2298]
MANCIFVETGQCGNQLGFSLLDTLYAHLAPSEELYYETYLDAYFRTPINGGTPVARSVCLDTEPKVINDCLLNAERGGLWRIDPKSCAYRHGGAGNNWALGYEMGSGEFLQTSIDMIGRELEQCDYAPSLVFMHSLAGGTGSGLGTRITESCEDQFPHSTRLNVAIAPYHFGEVVVQHYNAVLCLSKVAAASHAVLIFENEIAQMLCRTMRCVDKPSLAQLNETIASNLCPIFLPKYDHHRGQRRRTDLHDDLAHLCCHPGQKFLDIKVTPQTSDKSVAYTYDSWSTLVKTIQQMQLSGAASERDIRANLKFALELGSGVGQVGSPTFSVLSNVRSRANDMSPVGGIKAMGVGATAPPLSPDNRGGSAAPSVIHSFASVVTLHGAEAADAADTLRASVGGSSSSASASTFESADSSPSTRSARRLQALKEQRKGPEHGELRLHDLYMKSHSPLHSLQGGCAVQVASSPQLLNGYQRATSVLCNSQAVLPLLQRATREGARLFKERAYLHQYSTYGIGEEDFQDSFRSLGSAIRSYMQC